MTTLAKRVFDYQLDNTIADATDELIQLFGFGEDWFASPAKLSDVWYDYYDDSFELIGIRDLNWIPHLEALLKAWEHGFGRAWFCYVDGEERYAAAPSLEISDKHKSHRTYHDGESNTITIRKLRAEIDILKGGHHDVTP